MRTIACAMVTTILLAGGAIATAAPITTFTYTYDPAGHQPSGAWLDSTGAELNDNAIAVNWFDAEQVGTSNGTDDGLPQPQVNVAFFNTGFSLTSMTIAYHSELPQGIYPPDQLDLSFSVNGVTYSTPASFTGFAADSDPAGAYSITFNLGGQEAQYVRAAFRNDGVWTFVSEIDFEGVAIPEPASVSLLALGMVLGARRRCR